VGYAVQNLLSRAYFAKQKGKVPLIAGGVSILVNIVLCRLLADKLEVAGLALSSALSSTVYALFLLLPLQRGRERILDGGALRNLGKMVLAAGGMGACVWAALSGLAPLFPAGKVGELLCLGACGLLGAAVYFLLTLILRVEEAGLCVSVVKQTLKRG
jgi:putative peptidoglycan lipid II flippase